MHAMPSSLCLIFLLGCSSQGTPSTKDLAQPGGGDRDLQGTNDLATRDLQMPGMGADLATRDLSGPGADLAVPPDLSMATSAELDCYYNWKTLKGCPAPQITASYLSQDCAGTTGVFVIGRYFQSGNQFDNNNGWLPHGPAALSPKLNRDTWNWITPRMLCITTSADPGYWSNFDMQLKNPDGQTSNTVTVQNLLAGRPALPSTESSDPFDPNACYDPGMTMAEAVARFQPGATMTALGSLAIQRRSRLCNTLTGCAAWGAAAPEATVTAKLQTATSVHFALDSTDCGPVGAYDYTLTYNGCAAAGSAGSYTVHVAAACLMLSQTTRSAIAGDGSYTQTDYGAVLRY